MIRNDITETIPANITISGITAVCPAINTVSNLNDRFDPGEVIECTGDYILTQADLDKGSVTNVAAANVYTVSSNPVTTTVPTVSTKAITITKTANVTTYQQTGQQITFTYTIKNSGVSQLGPAQFTVTDSGINNNTPFNCGNADATLASGATLSCNATYTVTAADMNAASISTNATASGGGANPSQPVSFTLTKGTPPTAVAGGTSRQHQVLEGEWLWQIARCYGADPAKTVAANPQLSNPAELKAGMTITVPNVGSVGTVHAPPEPCVKKHVVQSGDTWTSIAQKYGADPGLTQLVNANTMSIGEEVKVPLYTVGLNLPLTTTNTSTSALALMVTPNTTTYSQAGQVIAFNYVIKNNGTTTLGPTQFTITDNFLNPTTFNCGPANTTLSTGATTTCTANYTVSQLDMGAVNVQFSTTAAGAGVPTSPAVATTISKGVSLLTFSVTANPTTYNQAGQIINFSYTIKNSGTTSLGPAQFTVTDNFLNPATVNLWSGKHHPFP